MRFNYVAVKLMLIGLSVSIGVLGCNRMAKTPSAGSDADARGAVTRVAVIKPQRKTLVSKTTQPARIEAYETTPVYSKLAGYVDQVQVDIGDKVKKDQGLVTLRVPELADDVTQKTALVKQAEAELKQAEANVTALAAAVETATAKIAEAQAGTVKSAGELERWRSEYERVKSLAGSGSLTQKAADEALNQLHAAEASQEAAKAAVQSSEAAARQAQANAMKAEADRAAAEAHVGVAKADLNRAKTMLDYATIRAPFDGVVTKRLVDTGHFVQPAASSGSPLVVVARNDKVRVYIEVPELEAGNVNIGDAASIHTQALPEGDIAAPITRTSWSLDPMNRSLRAEVDVANEGGQLRPGMYATGTIELVRRENALAVPATAIVRDGNASYCWTVVDGKLDRTPVQLGVRSGAEVEVLSGIDESSSVVIQPTGALATGQIVQAAETTK